MQLIIGFQQNTILYSQISSYRAYLHKMTEELVREYYEDGHFRNEMAVFYLGEGRVYDFRGNYYDFRVSQLIINTLTMVGIVPM